jgi:5-methylcytosine-specific restriction endonuclease McrBC GTP-binding regulatory subunit McrB
MNFWHMQMHQNDQHDANEIEIISKTGFIGLGEWEKGETTINDFKEKMSPHDIVVIRNGQSLIALVEILSESIYEPDTTGRLDWFENRRKVKVLDWAKNDNKIPMASGTLTRCSDMTAPSNKIILAWYKEVMEKMNYTKLLNIIGSRRQIILQGAPGTGKTRAAKEVASKLLNTSLESVGNHPNFSIVQFHTAYSYEDFVRGIMTRVEGGSVVYEVQNKVLVEIASQALSKPDENFVLVIDEINRANLPAVLGELIYALEYRGEPVQGVYTKDDSREIILPLNLFIIGTMNTSDRSVGTIDYAIRRRFPFYTIQSTTAAIEAQVGSNCREQALRLYKAVETIFEKLSTDFKVNELMIGHSYFLAESEDELQSRLEYEIKPLLWEYIKDGILVNAAKDVDELSL